MDEQSQAWYQSRFAKYVGIGILIWGAGTGVGNLARGILEGYKTQTQKIVYEMDKNTLVVQLERVKAIDRGLLLNEQRLSPEQVAEVLRELSGKDSR